MLLIELFDNTVEEGKLGDITKGIGKMANKAVKGAIRGANEFGKGVSGGKTDVLGTIDKFTNDDSELKKGIKNWFATNARNTRSVGADLDPWKQFDNIMPLIYGKNLTSKMKNEWREALETGKGEQGVGNTYRHLRQRSALQDPDQDPADKNAKLKDSHANVIKDFVDAGKKGQLILTKPEKDDGEKL